MLESVRVGAVRTWAVLLLGLAACSSSTPSEPTITPNTSGWWRNRVVYEVFVRSFADSGTDGIGDLKGLTARLDYLNDGQGPSSTNSLGVDAIWLMPIFTSPSYHGYDVADYQAINPAYGTMADFDAFVAAAHQRGIKVVLDMVLNHTSSGHPWFLESRRGPSDPRRDWYVWSATDPGWFSPVGSGPAWFSTNGAWYYAAFWSGMPDLNLQAPAVEQALVDSMKFWLKRGVDGFRLDAVRYLVETGPGAGQVDQPGTHGFLRSIRAALQRDFPDTLLVAEAWAGQTTVATYYGHGDEVQLAFSFDQAAALKAAALAGTSGGALSAVSRALDSLAGKDQGFQAPFLSNHDQVRVQREVGGDPGAARLLAATLLALPGTPFVYYGEELGMQGGAGSNDEEKRTPFRWTSTAPGYGFTPGGNAWWTSSEAPGVDVASEQANPDSLWNLYRRLIALRKGQAALTGTDASLPTISGGGAAAFAMVRSGGGKRVLFVGNFGTADLGALSITATGVPTVLLSEGLAGTATAAGGAVTLPGLAARGFAFLSLD